MDLKSAIQLVEEALSQSSVTTWDDYDPATIPFVLYDAEATHYINYPQPPAERPNTLHAATAIDIGGIQTATIPVERVNTVEDLIPLVYHEGFHVYQAHHFQGNQRYDFFVAMAHYPEFDATYRALCTLETQHLNQQQIDDATLAQLATIALERDTLFEGKNPNLLPYEREMANKEGTATFVEQQARQQLYGILPPPLTESFGWGRFYQASASMFWQLAQRNVSFTEAIASGTALSDLIQQITDPASSITGLDQAITQAEASIQSELALINGQIDELLSDCIEFRYDATHNIMRAFNPNTMRSLGDGRLLHIDFATILFGAGGNIETNNGKILLDDVVNQRVYIPKISASYNEANALIGESHSVNFYLSNATQIDEDIYSL
ncbi:MAG: hypothetical protein AAFV93_08275 [Chloroflexota bacterium]